MANAPQHSDSPLGSPRSSKAAKAMQWLTIQEVADLLRISRDTVERWIHTSELRAVDISTEQRTSRSAWRIASESLDEFLQTRANRPSLPRRAKPLRKDPDVIEFIK